MFKSSGSRKQPPRKREAQHDEYGREERGIIECPECHNVHFKKKWRASLRETMAHHKGARLPISGKKLCPACFMVRRNLFEGEVLISGFPIELREELLNLVNNFGERATEMDPQDRIIAVLETKQGYRVTTTENQIANRLAKKVKSSFNTVDVEFSHSKEPYEVDRVSVVFKVGAQ